MVHICAVSCHFFRGCALKYLYEIQVKWEYVVSCTFAAFVLLHDFELQSPGIGRLIDVHDFIKTGSGLVIRRFSEWEFTLSIVTLPLKGSGLAVE